MNPIDHAASGPEDNLRAALARLIEGESEPDDDPLVAASLGADQVMLRALRNQLELDALLRQDAEPTPEYFIQGVASAVRDDPESEAFVRRVRAALPDARQTWRISGGLAAAWAISLAAAVFAGLWLIGLGSESAASVVQKTLAAHAAPLDRCYRVDVVAEAGPASSTTIEADAIVDRRVWTRGDRFWSRTCVGERSAIWGRDEDGGVWFTTTPDVGARLAPEEVPPRLEVACDLLGLQLETLVRDILADFQLRREPADAGVVLIHAALKPGRQHPRYRSALLEVDARSHVLRRVVLQRAENRHIAATVTFTLLETSLRPESDYTLEGHLQPDARVHNARSGRAQRAEVIAEFMALVRVPAAR